MKYIFKFLPPKELLNWYNNEIPKPKLWNDLPSTTIMYREESVSYYSKEELRTFLFNEQVKTCCYCNRIVSNDYKSKIEHLKPRKSFPKCIFNYYNLALSCDGVSRRKNDKIFHCDTLKKGNEISTLPTSKKIKKLFRYDDEGNIFGATESANEIIKTLGLDCPPLINSRFETISELIWNDEIEIKSSKELREEFFRIINLSLDHKDQAFGLMLMYMSKKDRFICSTKLRMNGLKNFIKTKSSQFLSIPYIIILVFKYKRRNNAM